VTFVCIVLFITIPCYVCCCLRQKQHEAREFLEPEGTEDRLDPGSRRGAQKWPLMSAPAPVDPEAEGEGSGSGSDTDLAGEVFPYSPDPEPQNSSLLSPETRAANA